MQAKIFIKILLIFLFWYLVIDFALLSHNHLISYPVNHDDYSALAFNFHLLSWPVERPVSTGLIAFFALFGRVGYYLWMHCLAVLYPTLVFVFLLLFFEICFSWLWASLFAILVFSGPVVISVGKYLGLTTNLVSAIFGVLAMIALLQGHRKNSNWLLLFACLFFTICSFAKEDFILPNLLLLSGLLFDAIVNKNASRIFVWKLLSVVLYFVVSLICLGIFNQYFAHSVFVGAGADLATYRIDLHLLSIVATLWHYLIIQPYLTKLLMVASVVLLLSVIFLQNIWKLKLFMLLLILISLILPYTVLPNHIYDYYAYNWVPWEVGIIIFGAYLLNSRFVFETRKYVIRLIKIILFGYVVISVVVASLPARKCVALWYETNAMITKNILVTLTANRQIINKNEFIGVIGISGLSPWSLQKYNYLRDVYGSKSKWIVFVTANSQFYSISIYNKEKNINVLGVEEVCKYSDIKYLVFNPNGEGRLLDGKAACDLTRKKTT